MRKTIFLFIILLVLGSCRERKRKGAFQGAWFKQGYSTEAFSVREDSIFYPGIKNGYHYEFNKDTLSIQFTEKRLQSLILSFSSRKLVVWDMDLSRDTIILQRRASSDLDSLSN